MNRLVLWAGSAFALRPRLQAAPATWDREWPAVDEGSAIVGITACGAKVLGDVVQLRLPEVGTWVEAGQTRAGDHVIDSRQRLVRPCLGWGPGSLRRPTTRVSSTPLPAPPGGCSSRVSRTSTGGLSAHAFVVQCVTQGDRR
ncbi:glycine cleavage system protein H [Streptomyces sp. NPDC001292]|uniref:glycine cleavage system protein H n=1 Tax=Streptomyces sp. NPDC001292 TaxID=3364558 RepID=UPI003687146C